jgi:hypothetical protein
LPVAETFGSAIPWLTVRPTATRGRLPDNAIFFCPILASAIFI